jgi:hypothetical protein
MLRRSPLLFIFSFFASILGILSFFAHWLRGHRHQARAARAVNSAPLRFRAGPLTEDPWSCMRISAVRLTRWR